MEYVPIHVIEAEYVEFPPEWPYWVCFFIVFVILCVGGLLTAMVLIGKPYGKSKK